MSETTRTVSADEAEDLANEVRDAWEEYLADEGREDDFPSEQQETSYLLDALEAGDADDQTWELSFPDGRKLSFRVADAG